MGVFYIYENNIGMTMTIGGTHKGKGAHDAE